MKTEKCCGGCTHFKYETSDGSGWCEVGDTKTYCGFGTGCKDYEDEETIRRHHIAILLQWKRWSLSFAQPELYRMPNFKELKAAVDYAVKYMKGEI